MSTITIEYTNIPTSNIVTDLVSGWFLYKDTPILKLVTGECLYIRNLGSTKIFDYYPYQVKGELSVLLNLDTISINTTTMNVSLKNKNYSVVVLPVNESNTLAIRMYDSIYDLQTGEFVIGYDHNGLYEKADSFELSFLGLGCSEVSAEELGQVLQQ